MNFHTKNIEQTFELLEANTAGLSSSEADKRVSHFGYNRLPQASKKTISQIFLEQFKSPIIYILLIAAVISFAIKEYTDCWFIMAVLFINAIIGSYQEYTAGQKADSLKDSVKTFVNVLRDSGVKNIVSDEVTIGDIVLFESGSKVPADIRLISSKDLEVDESLLTGESINTHKDHIFLSDDIDLPVADRINMLYAGTFVAKGRAKGVVTSIAQQTQLGKIASLLAASIDVKAPLVIRMERFSLNIAKVIGVIVILLVFLGIYQNIGLKEIFFLSVALAVSSIPEGLPVSITVALSAASQIMSKKNVIVRKLSAIEGLGSCTFIASDKTGTLTKNELSVEHFVTLDKVYTKNDLTDQIILDGMILCNESSYKQKDDQVEFLGDQVDIALAKCAINIDEGCLDLRQLSKQIDLIPYESENAYSAVLCELDCKKYEFIKGSVEIVLEHCQISNKQKEKILQQEDDWADNGFRNIALAYKINNTDKIELEGYKFLGFASIIDPLRDDVKEAITKAQNAGIEVSMVTGDHPNTAYYIAKQLGIVIDKDEVISGVQIQHWIDKGENPEEIAHKRVFARVTPEHKQKIVTAFQSLGHFVAVTGDGVNDAPALKYSNIGISMGKSGTDAAREASDLILTDDAFSSIVNGIEQGRVAYDNIRKVIYLLISTGFAEIVLIVLSMLFFIPLPLLPVQLLWLNLVTNGIQDVTLGLEKAEDGVLNRKPRDPKEPIFNKIMISRILVGGLYMGITAFIVFYTLLNMGYSEYSARNITLILVVLFENVHVFNSRSENLSIFKIDHRKNLLLLLSVFFAQIIHIFSMYNPFMQSLLKLEPISFTMWLFLLSIALVLLVVMELEKIVFRSLRK